MQYSKWKSHAYSFIYLYHCWRNKYWKSITLPNLVCRVFQQQQQERYNIQQCYFIPIKRCNGHKNISSWKTKFANAMKESIRLCFKPYYTKAGENWGMRWRWSPFNFSTGWDEKTELRHRFPPLVRVYVCGKMFKKISGILEQTYRNEVEDLGPICGRIVRSIYKFQDNVYICPKERKNRRFNKGIRNLFG